MSTYIYKAKKSSAETVTGQIKASSQEEAIDLINQLGLLPVTVQEEVSEQSQIASPKQRKVSSKQLYVFSRQLANLLKSGLSLLRSLAVIEEQTTDGYFKSVVGQVKDGITNGRTFSDCLSAFPRVFSTLYITMVKAGEESGNLQEMLVNVAVHQSKQNELVSKVRTALAYPCLMAVVGAATIYFILTFVFPKMASLFDSMGENLPLPTVILLGISEFLNKSSLWFIIILAVVYLFLSHWSRSKQGKILSSSLFLKLPLFGDIILKSELARFCRTLVLLMKSGVSIINAIQIATPILRNELLKAHFAVCREALLSGGSFGMTMQKSPQIPKMMGHMITVGEESGNLNEVLAEIAEGYEQETDEKIKIMTTLLEPLMILAVGLIVGFIVFAMLLPIFQIDILGGA